MNKLNLTKSFLFVICLYFVRDIHESSLFWNLKKRYERNKIYVS